MTETGLAVAESSELFVGVDGGGTRCRAKLADPTGKVLGHGEAGPANARLGLDVALGAVALAATAALKQAGLDANHLGRVVACVGLAGLEVRETRGAAEAYPLPFKRTKLLRDGQIACLGAFPPDSPGGAGGIVICGTGSVAWGYANGTWHRLGGWGFELADQGSGAWLGHQALRLTLEALEGLRPASNLSETVAAEFPGDDVEHTCERMVRFAEAATPGAYGRFARAVLKSEEAGCGEARALMNASVGATAALARGLAVRGIKRLALVGGLAGAYGARLPADLRALLAEPSGDPLDGALAVARGLGAKP